MPAGKTQQLTSPNQVPDGLSKSDWASIRAAYEAGRHAFAPVAGGWQARNPGQQWLTRFDGRGFVAEPSDGGWQWGLELKRYGFPGSERAINGMPAVKAEGQRLTYAWDATVEEWFVNDVRGLEHGYTVRARPAGSADAAAPLQFDLAVRGSLAPRVEADGLGVEFRDAAGAVVLRYGGLKVWDADGKVLSARFEPLHSTLVTLAVEERGARYPITVDPIAQQAYLKASNTGASDGFDTLGDEFGRSVAVSGDTVVVGAPDNLALDAGAAYVFVRSGTSWSQQAYLKASNTGENDTFGYSVAVSGDTVVVGAHGEDGSGTGVNPADDDLASDAGAAYVFSMVANGPPIVSCPAPAIIGCTSVAGATANVTINVADADNDELTVTWSVNNVPVAAHVLAAGATSDSITADFGFGTTAVSVSVTDSKSAPVTCETTVTVTAHDAPVPSLASLPTIQGQCSASITETPTAIDVCAEGGLVSGTTTDPLSYTAQGTHTVSWTYTDPHDASLFTIQPQTVEVKDITPPTPDVISLPDVMAPCSAALPAAPTATDNCDGTITGVPDVSGPFGEGDYTIIWTYTDTQGNSSSQSQDVHVHDSPPMITSLTGPVGPQPKPYMAIMTVNFTDVETQGHTAKFSWDDGSPDTTVTAGANSASASHYYAAAGVYTITVMVMDDCGASVSQIFEFVVIYDPNGGFVTGGGWINSPAGAYKPDGNLSGRANYGFVSKYLKGATIPTGETEFQFQVANLNFHSTVYEWLVVSGPKGQYKGSGTINGAGDFGFLLTVTDGQVNGGGGVDKFRIKIWDKNNGGAIVYDNGSGTEDINASVEQAVAGGSIVVHK